MSSMTWEGRLVAAKTWVKQRNRAKAAQRRLLSYCLRCHWNLRMKIPLCCQYPFRNKCGTQLVIQSLFMKHATYYYQLEVRITVHSNLLRQSTLLKIYNAVSQLSKATTTTFFLPVLKGSHHDADYGGDNAF